MCRKMYVYYITAWVCKRINSFIISSWAWHANSLTSALHFFVSSAELADFAHVFNIHRILGGVTPPTEFQRLRDAEGVGLISSQEWQHRQLGTHISDRNSLAWLLSFSHACRVSLCLSLIA